MKLNDSLLSGSVNRFADTTAIEGNIYEYAVKDCDFFGGESRMSMTARAEIPASQPIQPAAVRAMVRSSGILVQWDKTSQRNLREYRIYRYQRHLRPLLISARKPNEALEILDRSARKGNLYFYFVTAVNVRGIESERSSEVGIRR